MDVVAGCKNPSPRADDEQAQSRRENSQIIIESSLHTFISPIQQKEKKKQTFCIMMPPPACKQLMIVLYYDLQKTETINIRKCGDVAAKRIEFFCQL